MPRRHVFLDNGRKRHLLVMGLCGVGPRDDQAARAKTHLNAFEQLNHGVVL